MLTTRPAVLVLSLVAAGCASAAAGRSSPALSAADLFPLRAGTSWTFERKGGPARVLELGVPNDAGQFPLFVAADGGERLPLARVSIEGGGALVVRSPEGVQVLLRDPIRRGASWEWDPSSQPSAARRRARVESIEEKELAGVVRTHVVVSYGPSGAAPNERYRFARGVGWVGIERLGASGGGSETLELRAFSPGSEPEPNSAKSEPATGG